MKLRKITDSFNNAIAGIIYTVKTQRNMKIHMVAAILILIFSLFFDFSRVELLILFLTITLVIVMEMVNTAVESAVDMIANYYHPLAKIAKNVAAGAVLVAALNAIVVGYMLFFDRLKPITTIVFIKIRQSDTTVVFISMVVVIILTIIIKAVYGKGTPLKGGMPSGHTAIAVSAATAISLKIPDPLVITLSYLSAFLVAHSRYDAKIHTLFEIISGGLLGFLVTLLLYKLF